MRGQQAGNQSATTQTNQTIVVTGTFVPVPLNESNRSVEAFDFCSEPLLYSSFVDYLSEDSSVDVQQREVDGEQADLSIRGSSFGQNLVLLNGLRLNDAQTGHHDLDLPFPLEALSGVEVLHGGGSLLYGADAVGGAVNFVTSRPDSAELRVRLGGGNFGFNEQRAIASFRTDKVGERLAMSRDASAGFEADRDYRNSSLSTETWTKTALGTSDILLSASDHPFGAGDFYGIFPSSERTKGWFGGLNQQLGSQTSVSFGYRRHSDEFILFRDDPSFYENNHITQSWQADLRRHSNVGKIFGIAYGVTADGDQITSNNLGNHARNRTAGYANVDMRYFRRISASIGGREEILSGGLSEFSPQATLSVWLRPSARLRGSIGRGFRLPSYTDLYYQDPANIGNPLLKPEISWSLEGGFEWVLARWVTASTTFFQRRDQNDIDYVRDISTDPWRAENIGHVVFNGLENSVQLTSKAQNEQLRISYTVIAASQQPLTGISEYVFNFPSHRATVTWIGRPMRVLSLSSTLQVVQRYYTDPYALWSFAASANSRHVRPFVQFFNLSSTVYQEIPGVHMPGRSIVGGLEFDVSKAHHL